MLAPGGRARSRRRVAGGSAPQKSRLAELLHSPLPCEKISRDASVWSAADGPMRRYLVALARKNYVRIHGEHCSYLRNARAASRLARNPNGAAAWLSCWQRALRILAL